MIILSYYNLVLFKYWSILFPSFVSEFGWGWKFLNWDQNFSNEAVLMRID